jgi:hypothetical protein
MYNLKKIRHNKENIIEADSPSSMWNKEDEENSDNYSDIIKSSEEESQLDKGNYNIYILDNHEVFEIENYKIEFLEYEKFIKKEWRLSHFTDVFVPQMIPLSDYFPKFFPHSFFKIICKYTNKYASQIIVIC